MERKIQSLAGEWELVRVDKRTGLPAGNPIPGRVPGDVITDLVRNGMLEEPYRDFNSDKCRWVNDYDWLYRTEIPGGGHSMERKFLRFSGVDYEAWFRLNGHVLGSHEGMFGRVVFEITGRLDAGNDLEVLLVGRGNGFRERMKFLSPALRNWGARRKGLKAQYSHGWDFAPSLKGAGIWDDVHLHTTGPVALDDLWIRGEMRNEEFDAEIFFSARTSGDGEIVWRVEGVNHSGSGAEGSEKLRFAAGPQKLKISSRLKGVLPWEPWDMGEPNLYRLSVEFRLGNEVSDAISDTFGFVDVGFETNPRAPGGSQPWTAVINGKRLYLRGVNWVPVDSLPGRMEDVKYGKLLAMAREMGANFIRVWGGGLREKRVFYDTCDRLGLLVWQEFPFACSFTSGYPRSQRYVKLVSRECAEIVRLLRNHPSLLMWCGGSELHYRKNAHIINLLKNQVKTHDGTRRFHPVSPSAGDSHNWLVWHGKGNLEDYIVDASPFVSEFGLQAAPARETMEKMLSDKYLWPPDKKAWEHHNVEWAKMLKYSRRAGHEDSLEGFVGATQRMQAHILKTAVERWRRMKFIKGGFAIWQLNEPWPSVSWSVVDYYCRPKAAYEALKMSMAPLAVALYYRQGYWMPGDVLHYDIAVINDYHRPFHGLVARVCAGGKELDSARFEVRPNSVAASEDHELLLTGESDLVLEVELADAGGRVVARNEHDLRLFDPDRALFLRRVADKLFWKWLTRRPPEE